MFPAFDSNEFSKVAELGAATILTKSWKLIGDEAKNVVTVENLAKAAGVLELNVVFNMLSADDKEKAALFQVVIGSLLSLDKNVSFDVLTFFIATAIRSNKWAFNDL